MLLPTAVVADEESAVTVTPEIRAILLEMSGQDPSLFRDQPELQEEDKSDLEVSELVGPTRDLQGLLPLAKKVVAAKIASGVVKSAFKNTPLGSVADEAKEKVTSVLKGLSKIGPSLNIPALDWKYSATMEGKQPTQASFLARYQSSASINAHSQAHSQYAFWPKLHPNILMPIAALYNAPSSACACQLNAI
jgi:hypothetical protein